MPLSIFNYFSKKNIPRNFIHLPTFFYIRSQLRDFDFWYDKYGLGKSFGCLEQAETICDSIQAVGTAREFLEEV